MLRYIALIFMIHDIETSTKKSAVAVTCDTHESDKQTLTWCDGDSNAPQTMAGQASDDLSPGNVTWLNHAKKPETRYEIFIQSATDMSMSHEQLGNWVTL